MEERKLATILFADLVGSTELAASQDPERNRALLERFYSAMAGEIAAAGGTIGKFAGDAVLAAFGAPVAYEDHAERALHTALSMRRQLERQFGQQLILRIGVNTGDVMVGQPRDGPFVTGDAVNVAARLEQAASPGDILVGERTVAASRGAFEFAEPMMIEAKGKPEGVPCRRLIRSLSLTRPRGIPGLMRAFVGREKEFNQLLAAYRGSARERRPTLVTIVGDAGVGKTRLVRELWSRLADEHPQPLRRIGRCLPYGRGITYWPFGEMLREQLGILESDSPDEVRRRLGDRGMLGLTLGLDVAGELHPLAARDRLQDAWVDFVNSLVAERPLVAVIEDLHWAEPPLLDLIEQLTRNVNGSLLLLGTARPDFIDARAGWGSGRYQSRTIWLEPLSPTSAGAVIDSVIGAGLPDEARRILIDRAEGNPLFIEEFLASLVDRGVIDRHGEAWSVSRLPEKLQIPDSVHAVVAARLDLLKPSDKAALQAAAVVGRTFWTGAVYDLIDEEPDLRALEDRDFIRRHEGSSFEGEREYTFKHAITREVAYASVPRAARARLHAAFAEWIERRIGPRDDVAPILAHHYATAVVPENADLAWPGEPDRLNALRHQAIRWLVRSGELAMGRYEVDVAASLFQQALTLRPRREEEVRLWRLLGRAAALRYDGMGLWQAMQQAIDRCEDLQVLGELYAEVAYETAGRAGMWTRFPDRALVQGWIDRALELTKPETRARAQALIALGYWQQQDRPEWAVTDAEGLTERLGEPELRVDASEVKCLSEFAAGRYQSAMAAAVQAFQLEREISDPDTSAGLRESLTALFTICGRLPEARQAINDHNEITKRLSPHHRLHAVALEIELLEVLGQWEAIESLDNRARSAVEENRSTPCVRGPRSLLVCAAAHAAAGHHTTALALEREADDLHIEGWGWLTDAPRIRLAVHRQDLATVRRIIAAAPSSIPRRAIWYFPAAVAAQLDALAVLGEVEDLDTHAAEFLDTDTALSAMAMRALGTVRNDQSLLAAAASRFQALGFSAQATRLRVG